LDRKDGTYDAALQYDVTLFDSGRIEGHTVGTIDIRDADYERAGEFALALERAEVNLDVRYTWSESDDFALQGQVATELGRSSGALTDKTRLAVESGRVAFSGLDTAYAHDGALRIALQPEIDLEGIEFSGPIEVSVDKVLELLTLLQSLSAATTVSTADTGLGDYAGGSIAIPSSDIKLARLTNKGEHFSLQSAEGQVELSLKSRSDLFDIQIAGDQRHTSVERFQSVLERLSLTSGQGRLALDMAGTNALNAGATKGPLGEMKIGAYEAKIGTLGLQAQTGAVSLQLAALASKASGFSGLAYAAEGLPEAQLHLSTASAAIDEASVDAQGDALRWQATGGAAVIETFTADFAKGQEGAIKFGRAEVKALQANDQLQLAADALTVDGLDVYVKRSLVDALVHDGGTRTGDAAAKSGGATAPLRPAAQAIDVRRVQVLLTELGYAPGPVDGRMGRRTAAAISAFQKKEGLGVDGRLTGGLLTALESRAAAPAERVAVPTPGTDAAKPAGASVRVGHLALTGKPVLRFRDETVTPQVKVDTVVKELKVKNFNTQKAKARTELSLIADVNEFTQVALAGWVAGLGDSADMDVKAKLENVELSTYSPYVAELAGVYLESGQLDTVTTAKTQRGALQGEIQLELDDIAFRPLSKQDAERLSGTLGVPLETAVSLLQDNEGRIALTLPVSGALSKPKVDVSSAVSKAIGGALKKVFPPTMVASMLGRLAKTAGPALAPIEFAPGSAELDEAGKRYANDVLELLAKHPKLSLKVCGRSTAQDMAQFMTQAAPPTPRASDEKGKAAQPDAQPVADAGQLDQALVELAVARGRTLRRYLIQEKNADAKRLPECRSTFEAADQGSPRVEISL
jgi:peptidoglycan hydrolase-like protein with peptidoglycan-binding domain